MIIVLESPADARRDGISINKIGRNAHAECGNPLEERHALYVSDEQSSLAAVFWACHAGHAMEPSTITTAITMSNSIKVKPKSQLKNLTRGLFTSGSRPTQLGDCGSFEVTVNWPPNRDLRGAFCNASGEC